MHFETPLIEGRLVRRYKRFLSDIELEGGERVTAHCANPGSMLGLTRPGAEVWLSPAANPARKLAFTWELVQAEAADAGSLVGINTGHANTLAAEAIRAGTVAELSGYPELRREIRYGQASRIDLLLEAPDRPGCYVEVKSVTLKRGGRTAEFPDSVTKRGTKHLEELSGMAAQGARSVMLFVAQRGDCDGIAVAADIDPAYGAALQRARRAGVEVLCYSCRVSPGGIEVDRAVPLRETAETA